MADVAESRTLNGTRIVVWAKDSVLEMALYSFVGKTLAPRLALSAQAP